MFCKEVCMNGAIYREYLLYVLYERKHITVNLDSRNTFGAIITNNVLCKNLSCIMYDAIDKLVIFRDRWV